MKFENFRSYPESPRCTLQNQSKRNSCRNRQLFEDATEVLPDFFSIQIFVAVGAFYFPLTRCYCLEIGNLVFNNPKCVHPNTVPKNKSTAFLNLLSMDSINMKYVHCSILVSHSVQLKRHVLQTKGLFDPNVQVSQLLIISHT